ncbi:hypothetical protein XaC1_378 [Xanthomonas phage XaC1]|nr:hypothetical protein XaC1_378 [Xanthomonas phage XaC1]
MSDRILPDQDIGKSTDFFSNLLGKLDYENLDLSAGHSAPPKRNIVAESRLETSYNDIDLEGSYNEYELPQQEPIFSDYTPMPQHREYQPQVVLKEAWKMIGTEVPGMKNVKKYSIQSNYNQQNIVEGIMMQEAAIALLKVLNEGGSLSDPKVLGIMSYGIQYTDLLEKALKSVKSRQIVLNESNYSRAMELDKDIAEYKTQAQSLKAKIISFINANGFGTK